MSSDFQEYLRLALYLLLGIAAIVATLYHATVGVDEWVILPALAAGWFLRTQLYPHREGEE